MKIKTFKLRIICQESGNNGGSGSVKCHKCNGGWINDVNYTCNKCGYKL